MGIRSKIKRAIKNPTKAVKGTYYKFDQSAGKKFFGNTVGLRHNLSGSINLMKNSNSNLKSTKPIIEQFRSQGFLNMGLNYDQSLIEKIKTKYDQMIEDDNFSFASGQYDGKTFKRQIIEPQLNIPEVSSILTDSMINILEEYYGGHFQVVRIDLWRTYNIPSELEDKDIISNRWHCDNRKTDRLKLFVNLSNVSEMDGPLHLQSIPRTKEIMKMKFKHREDYGMPIEIMEDPKHVVKCTGPAGSTFFANTTTCFHKAGNPQNARDMLQFLFKASKEPLSKNWIKNVIHVGPDVIDTTEE